MAKMMNVVYTSERVDVVHAHWAFKGTAYGCSNCGNGVILPGANYCEECGAKMDKVAPNGMYVMGVAPDRVDVVRCRDCKYRYTGHPDTDCEICAGRDDWFCADGERRDANDDRD